MYLWVLECCNVSLDNTSKTYSSELGFLESYQAWSQKKIIRCAPLFFMTPGCMYMCVWPISGLLASLTTTP